jgi:hypothetical protein
MTFVDWLERLQQHLAQAQETAGRAAALSGEAYAKWYLIVDIRRECDLETIFWVSHLLHRL